MTLTHQIHLCFPRNFDLANGHWFKYKNTLRLWLVQFRRRINVREMIVKETVYLSNSLQNLHIKFIDVFIQNISLMIIFAMWSQNDIQNEDILQFFYEKKSKYPFGLTTGNGAIVYMMYYEWNTWSFQHLIYFMGNLMQTFHTNITAGNQIYLKEKYTSFLPSICFHWIQFFFRTMSIYIVQWEIVCWQSLSITILR